jgi:hypothetical protein
LPADGKRAACQILWRRDLPKAATFGASPLVHDGLLYGLAGGGVLHVFDAAGGDRVYAEKLANVAPAKSEEGASLVLAGGRLYAANLGSGKLTVVLRPGRRLEKVWQYAVDGGVGQPAFCADRQYVRSLGRLHCIGGTTPQPPVAPPPSVAISPPKDLKLDPGTPVSPFEHNTLSTKWLTIGPFPKRDIDRDHLASVGGKDKVIPVDGMAVTYEGTTLKWRRLEDHNRWTSTWTGGMEVIDITGAQKRVFHSEGYFFRVLDIRDRCYVKFEWLPGEGAYKHCKKEALQLRIRFAGKPLERHKIYALEKGRYPLMIQTSMGATTGSGKIFMNPRFVDVTPDHLPKLEAYERLVKAWPLYQDSLKKLFILN